MMSFRKTWIKGKDKHGYTHTSAKRYVGAFYDVLLLQAIVLRMIIVSVQQYKNTAVSFKHI